MDNLGWRAINDFVLTNNYCSGCGACEAICRRGAIRLRFNEYGELRPYPAAECVNCGLCSKVCPFIDGNPNEDALAENLYGQIKGVRHLTETGYCLGAFVGYVNNSELRWNSASGGLATWFLESLLTRNLVDGVLCVASKSDANEIFGYRVCKTIEDVRACARSCYYPVSAGNALSHIIENEGRYAIVGLPCACKAIRLAQQQSKILRERIKYVAGLACGQMKSKAFTEYVCALGGGNPANIKKVEFRVKDKARPASDFGLRFICEAEDGDCKEGEVFWTQGMGKAWTTNLFTVNACAYCDDLFAECADVVFMDAWLPEYSGDSKGHSLALTRNEVVHQFFAAAQAESTEALVRSIGVDSVIRSQAGALASKRGGVRDRIALAKASGAPTPTKRNVVNAQPKLFGTRKFYGALHNMALKSRAAWLRSGRNISMFENEMQETYKELDRARRVLQRWRWPNALLRRIKALYR